MVIGTLHRGWRRTFDVAVPAFVSGYQEWELRRLAWRLLVKHDIHVRRGKVDKEVHDNQVEIAIAIQVCGNHRDAIARARGYERPSELTLPLVEEQRDLLT